MRRSATVRQSSPEPGASSAMRSKFHQDTKSTTFVFSFPGTRRRRSIFTARRASKSAPVTGSSIMSTAQQRLQLTSQASPSSPKSPQAHLGEESRISFSRPGSSSDAPNNLSRDLVIVAASPSGPGPDDHIVHSKTVPAYNCPMSEMFPDQLKALAWLTQVGRTDFDTSFTKLLAGWGVSPRHTGTCVLVLEEWKSSDPLDLMAWFSHDSVPLAGSPRARYTYTDHRTTLARAKVWFAEPSRTGVELDDIFEDAHLSSQWTPPVYAITSIVLCISCTNQRASTRIENNAAEELDSCVQNEGLFPLNARSMCLLV